MIEPNKRRTCDQTAHASGWDLIGAVALAILAYSGQLGASPVLGWLPVNATGLALAVVACSLVITLLAARRVSPMILIPLAIWLLLLLPAAEYVPGSYAAEKTTSIATLLLLCLVAPFQLLRLRIQKITFLWTLAGVGLLSAVATLTQGHSAAAEAGLAENIVILDGANTIGTARIIGTGALVFITVALQMQGHGVRRLVTILTGLTLVMVMVATGSRGPLAAIILGCLAFMLVVPALRGRRVRSLTLLGLSGAVAFSLSASQALSHNDRAYAWLFEEPSTAVESRENLWRVAASYMSHDVTGTGWGGFAPLVQSSAERTYPHNLLLELYVEAGWPIATMVVLAILVAFISLLVSSKDPVSAIFLALAIFTFVNAMVSGDINDNRLFWMLISVGWLSMNISRRDELAPSRTKAKNVNEVESLS